MKDKATDVKSGADLKLTWNNARLNTLATYYKLVPGFERLLKQCGGNVEAFYREVEKLGNKSAEERTRMLAGDS